MMDRIASTIAVKNPQPANLNVRMVNDKGHVLAGGKWYEAPAWTIGSMLYITKGHTAYTIHGEEVELKPIEQ